MKEMNLGMLNKMMEPNTAFSVMIADVGQVDDLTAMEELIMAIEQQICLPRKISVMELFSIWAHMEPVHA
jgi:hypothetical protein|tara:strand:+ start:319 stop:528 length:210 start_codon:yes stop_codon:yes gene_type:complete